MISPLDQKPVKAIIITELQLQSFLVLRNAGNVETSGSAPSLISDCGFSPEPGFPPGCFYHPVPGEEAGSGGGK